ncbi:MAG: hypothetical protein AB1805_11145 [Nitrospirota bacterium]
MIVYRKQEQEVPSARCLAEIQGMVERLCRMPRIRHEEAVELLIEWGVFESAVADARCPERDDHDRSAATLRSIGVVTGHIVLASWEGRDAEALRRLALLQRALAELPPHDLPERVCLREPEGYAHYGLYPETYLEAAKRFAAEARPDRVVCIGLRSIGTSLSAVVAAALEAAGCAVLPCTMRPRGDPFYRSVLLTPSFEAVLRDLNGHYFLIMDEGPGMSGSSICAPAEKLSALGIADSRIVFFPSWDTDGRHFISRPARERWAKHRRITAWFDDVLLRSGRLNGIVHGDFIRDISAGMWRDLFYREEDDAPAVQPQHEKRKFLYRNSAMLLFKFAGLGRYGRAKLQRALALADAGLTPPVQGLSNGFMTTAFIDGVPLSPGAVDREALDSIVRYLRFLGRSFPVERGMRFEELTGMIRRNTLLGLGRPWADRLDRIEVFRSLFDEAGPVAVDGRMLPHEWIRTDRGYLKTDAIDHHADQFFPCSQDIAWDIAGCMIEFGLEQKAAEYLLASYEAQARDTTVRRRLPLYRIAYLAYRIGYTTFALNGLGASEDAQKFRRLITRYAALLKEDIGRIARR